MNGFNVLRGREPIKKGTKSGNDVYYCAGYIKYLPARGGIYGIEFSGTKKETGVTDTYNNPNASFDYYIYCSENAFIKALQGIVDAPTVGNPSGGQDTRYPIITNKLSNASTDVGNPASFLVSHGTFDKDTAPTYPHSVGFGGVEYSHDPRPYSNVDGFTDSNNVQYPLYLLVKFTGTPSNVNQLDYQIIYES